MSASVSNSDDTLLVGATDATPAGRPASAIVSEGVLAGVIAASAVAALFLVVDLVAGDAFRTPRQLGAMLLSLGGSGDVATDVATPLALYTLFHFVAFIVAGVVVAAMVQVTMRQPATLLLFLIVFFAFEVAFTGFVAVLDVKAIGGLTPYQVAAGNVVASIAMALFFTARYPRLRSIVRIVDRDEG